MEYPTPHTANPGDTLRNGAILIAKYFSLNGRCYVAAKYDGQHVSWRLESNGACSFGEYFFSGTEKEQRTKATQSAKQRAQK